MSVAGGFGINGKSYYTNISKPIDVNLNFIVDSTNGNGLGIRSLKSNGYVQSVFMNSSPAATTTTSVFASGVSTIQLASVTNIVPGEVITDSTTGGNITGGTTVVSVNPVAKTIQLSLPTAGASAVSPGDTLSFAMTPALVGNPSPIAGYAMVIFTNNFNKYIGGFQGTIPPLASNNLTDTVAGHVYVITLLGTTTLSQWQAAGLPLGIVPAVGVSFVATATASFGGTGRIGAPGVASYVTMSIVGDPNLSISNSNISKNGGAIAIVEFQNATSAGVTTLIPTAPADGSVIGMTFRFDGSSVTVDGL